MIRLTHCENKEDCGGRKHFFGQIYAKSQITSIKSLIYTKNDSLVILLCDIHHKITMDNSSTHGQKFSRWTKRVKSHFKHKSEIQGVSKNATFLILNISKMV